MSGWQEGKKVSKRKYILAGILFLFVLFVLIAIAIATKTIRITPWFAGRYEVQGIDVSHYQGDIDWKKIEEQDISFAFIKATEGSRTVDEYFHTNWEAASQTGMAVGAYHFFSFDSGAEKQAELFINTVGELSGKLIPVVDVEYYGDKEKNPPERETVVEELKKFLAIFQTRYQVKPMIYSTYQVYRRYIKGAFDEYPLWLRNVYYLPNLDGNAGWTFWQYTDTAELDGYEGEEKYIDKNVFNGSEQELENWIVH